MQSSLFGPDVTFVGIKICDIDDPKALKKCDAVIIGAPYDWGTSFRPGARFAPSAIRSADYLKICHPKLSTTIIPKHLRRVCSRVAPTCTVVFMMLA